MTTEVFERIESAGLVKRDLYELPITPSELLFGTHFSAATDDTESSTTSTTYQEKLKLTTPALAIDDKYVLFWYLEFKSNLQNKNSAIRVQAQDTEDLVEVETEGNEWTPITGFGIYTVTIAGVKTVDIDYRAIDGTAYIRRARLLGWKVGTV